MKILLTGEPRSGKTTLLQQLTATLPNAYWIHSKELRNEDGDRIGFQAETSDGLSGVFAHKADIESDTKMGEYAVDLVEINRLFTEQIRQSIIGSYDWVVVDEIGRMQMLSPHFASAVTELLNADVNVLATIRYGDDWTKQFTELPGVQTLTLTVENRDEMKARLESKVKSSKS